MDIGLIIAIIVTFAVGYKIGQWSILVQVLKDIATLRQKLETAVADEELIRIERVNGLYFAYGQNNRFLAQGADFLTMFTVIKDRFPNHDFRVDKAQSELTEDETTEMIDGIFKVFGDNKESKNG